MRPLMTVVGGRIVYKDPAFAATGAGALDR